MPTDLVRRRDFKLTVEITLSIGERADKPFNIGTTIETKGDPEKMSPSEWAVCTPMEKAARVLQTQCFEVLPKVVAQLVDNMSVGQFLNTAPTNQTQPS